MSFRLSSSQRLKTPAQFQYVYRSRQWGASSYFTYNVLGKSSRVEFEQTPAVLGVTVSKKVSKKAVDRNRIKRQVREFFRHHQSELNGADIVITAKPSCLAADDQARYQSLHEMWQKVLKWQRWHQRQLVIQNEKK